jgi:UDP-N-acetylglucosamine 2-epimerase (non-hydrolysing)
MDMLRLIEMPAIFPLHPRTMKRICEFNFSAVVQSIPDLVLIPPESYIDFLSLLEGSALIISDSGSVQAEASFFDIPCLVCRENTERPIYIEHGTSVLIGRDKERLRAHLDDIKAGTFKQSAPAISQLGHKVAAKTVKTIDNFIQAIGTA